MSARRCFFAVTGIFSLMGALSAPAQTISDARGFYSSISSQPNTASVTAGVSGFAMLITGSGFTAVGSTRAPRLQWLPSNTACPGTACTLDTFYLSDTQLQVEIPGYLVALADSGARIQVSNYPYSTRSNTLAFPVNAAMQPASLPAGAVGTPYSARLFNGGTPPMVVALGAGAGSYPPGLTTDASGNLAGTPTATGAYTFSPRVLDAWNTLANGDFSLTIGAAGTALSFAPATLPGGVVGVPYSATLTGSGGSGPYTFAVATGQLPPGLTLASGGAISGTPTNLGAYDIGIRVTAAGGNSSVGNRTIVINATATGLSFTPSTLPGGVSGASYVQVLSGINGTPPYAFALVSGNMPPGVVLSAAGVISGTPTGTGAFVFGVRVTDAAGASVSGTLSLTVTLPPSTVTFTPSALPGGALGSPYSAALTGTGGTAPYTFAIDSGGLPAGLTLSSNGAIAGVPRQSGSFSITVRVQDALNAIGFGDAAVTIADALQITATTLAAAQVYQTYTAQLEATGGRPPYRWLLTSGALPSGLVLNAGTGSISGTPDAEGDSNFVVTVRDFLGATASAALQITVAPPPPAITSVDLPPATAGAAYSASLTAVGGSGAFQWTVASGPLPAGLALSGSGAISGVPAEAGLYPLTVVATDSGGRTASAILQLRVNPPALAISTGLLPPTPGGAVALPFAAIGGATPYTWTVAEGPLPPGLSLSTAGMLAGKTSAIGTFPFRLVVTDSKGATATRAYSLQLTPGPLEVLTKSMPPGTVGSSYSVAFEAEGGTQPFRWSAQGLPPGLTMSASGMVTGAPTADGSFRVTVQVAESGGESASALFELSIVPPPLAIDTASLPPGSADVRYSVTFEASGGVKPYNWLIVGGALPGGLIISSSGVFSGVPQSPGSTQLAVLVSDARGTMARRELLFEVLPLPLTILTQSLPGGIVGQSYSQGMSATGGRWPYTWSGSLAAGLEIDPVTGVIAGIPTTPGTVRFGITVTDSAGAEFLSTYEVAFRTTVLPAPTLTGFAESSSALSQMPVRTGIAEPFPAAIEGTLQLEYRADDGGDDEAVQFSSGGRDARFTIPAHSIDSDLGPSFGLQAGTLAGSITITASLASGGERTTVARAIRIAAAAPGIASLAATRAGAGIEVRVTGFSTTRELTAARFRFFDAGGKPVGEAVVPAPPALASGGQFSLAETFPAAGVEAVTVVLSNRLGDSSAAVASVR